jgi:predicted nucleic acid-binding protein
MNSILDTGPWVALIDRSETSHDICVQWLKQYSGSLYSTEAVLTEVLYLLSFSIKAQEAAISFVINSVVDLVPSSVEGLKKAMELMIKYSDLPMDYADATIVYLAMETGINNIITLDKKDFSIYRIKKKALLISP